MLCKTLADELVGENALGKIIKFDKKDNLMISGVFEDFPANSQFAEIKVLMPLDYFFTQSEANRKKMNNWEDYSFQCFVQLNEKASFNQVDAKLKNFLIK